MADAYNSLDVACREAGCPLPPISFYPDGCSPSMAFATFFHAARRLLHEARAALVEKKPAHEDSL